MIVTSVRCLRGTLPLLTPPIILFVAHAQDIDVGIEKPWVPGVAGQFLASR
jgi:hypothetical protein